MLTLGLGELTLGLGELTLGLGEAARFLGVDRPDDDGEDFPPAFGFAKREVLVPLPVDVSLARLLLEAFLLRAGFLGRDRRENTELVGVVDLGLTGFVRGVVFFGGVTFLVSVFFTGLVFFCFAGEDGVGAFEVVRMGGAGGLSILLLPIKALCTSGGKSLTLASSVQVISTVSSGVVVSLLSSPTHALSLSSSKFISPLLASSGFCTKLSMLLANR